MISWAPLSQKKRHKILCTLVKDKEIISHSVGLSLSQRVEECKLNGDLRGKVYIDEGPSKVALSWRQRESEKRTTDIK